MEITNMDTRTWEAMVARFANFSQRVETLCEKSKDMCLRKWLDNQDVCEILQISKRTLQTYRDNGMLSFTQIGHKMFYRPEDVAQVINRLTQKKG